MEPKKPEPYRESMNEDVLIVFAANALKWIKWAKGEIERLKEENKRLEKAIDDIKDNNYIESAF